eukprot:2519500-Pleurochrysis_carterae.AAC.1
MTRGPGDSMLIVEKYVLRKLTTRTSYLRLVKRQPGNAQLMGTGSYTAKCVLCDTLPAATPKIAFCMR